MNDKTLGIIYAIKKSNKSWDKAVAKFMSKYSGSPEDEYADHHLNAILKDAFADYMATCDSPYYETRILLDMMDSTGFYSLGHYLATTLMLTRVKDDYGNYINGFREMKKEK